MNRIRTAIAVAVAGADVGRVRGRAGRIGSAPGAVAYCVTDRRLSTVRGGWGADAPQRAVPAMPPLADPTGSIRTVDLAVRLVHRDDLGRPGRPRRCDRHHRGRVGVR